jgi:hypothetical protein
MCRDLWLKLLLLLILSNGREGELDFLVFTNHFSAFRQWYIYIILSMSTVHRNKVMVGGAEKGKVDRHAAAAGLSRERVIDRDYGWETSLSPFANTFEKTMKNTRKTNVCASGVLVYVIFLL